MGIASIYEKSPKNFLLKNRIPKHMSSGTNLTKQVVLQIQFLFLTLKSNELINFVIEAKHFYTLGNSWIKG